MLFSLFCLSLLSSFNVALSAPIEDLSATKVFEGRNSHSFDSGLRALLSPNATIVHSDAGVPRWSDYHAPKPRVVVNVATEQDVQAAVKYCVDKNVPFLAQSGANGWSSSFNLERHGVLINLRGIDSVAFNSAKTEATIQGGALIGQVIDAAYANDAQVVTGNSNCVGALGTNLGGGYGNLGGLYGLGVDNILSLNTVLADGTSLQVTPDHDDLFWALRGAAPNFGIVTSVVMKSYPVPASQSTAWTGILLFTEDKIESIVQAIQDLTLDSNMNIYLYFGTSGAPSFTPTVVVTPFYYGSEQSGKTAFASILVLQPFFDTTAATPYNQWNAGGDSFCVKGGRKPTYSAGLQTIVPETWRAIWHKYTEFLRNNGTGSSVVLLEAFSMVKIQSVPDNSSAFPHRQTRFNAVVIPWYADRNLDPQAEAFGSSVRSLWRSVDSVPQASTYVNYAFGDEDNQIVYGASTPRLRNLKRQYDELNVFHHWFAIDTESGSPQ